MRLSEGTRFGRKWTIVGFGLAILCAARWAMQLYVVEHWIFVVWRGMRVHEKYCFRGCFTPTAAVL